MANKKILTAEEKAFEQAIAEEQSLARYHRQYEILNRNRVNMGASCSVKSHQNKVIEIFRQEKKNILINLKVATAPCKRKEDLRTSNELLEVLDNYDDYDRKGKRLKEYLKELDGQIYLKQREILDLQSAQTTDRQFYDAVRQARAVVEKLENKLEVSMKKFGSICHENKMLRDRINSLLSERNRFNEGWNRLIRSLTMGKRFMLDLIEQATVAYDQREEWANKMEILRRKSKIQLQMQLQEIRQLTRKRDHDEKLRNFLALKNTRRYMRDLRVQEEARRRQLFENIEIKAEAYKKMIDEIEEFCQEKNAEIIAKHYLSTEESNYSKFLRLIHINNEMEELNEAVFENNIEIDRSGILANARRQQQKERIDELKVRLEIVTADKKQSENALHNVDKMIAQLHTGITKLFQILKCDNNRLKNKLVNKDKIDPFNTNIYLSCIEETVHEMMRTANHASTFSNKVKSPSRNSLIRKPKNFTNEIIPLDEIVAKNPCPLCAENELVHDIIDTLQHVMNKDQVQEALRENLALSKSSDKLHNVSECFLPKSRAIIQKRYQ